MKVVINNCFGGFGLSPKAVLLYAKLSNRPIFGYIDDPDDRGKPYGERGHIRYTGKEKETPFIIFWLWSDLGDKPEDINKGEWAHIRDIKRDDLNLIQVVEKMGSKANDRCADLKIVEIPDGVEYVIEEYDGNEHIAEQHRTWS